MLSNSDRKSIHGRSIRWNEERAAEAYASGVWIRETLADSLQRAALDTPKRVVLIDDDKWLTCECLCAQAKALSQALLARAPSGSVLSFMLPNWHEAAVIYMAATLAGMVVNPILPSLRDRELSFILQDVESRFIFVPSTFRAYDYVALLERVMAPMELAPEVVVLRGDAGSHSAYDSLFESLDRAQELPALDPDAVRMILYTSGTTGRPKGVLHSHNSIHALIRQIGEHWMVQPGDKFLVASPIAHIGGSIYAFECPLLLGTTAVLMNTWNADEAVEWLDGEACTHMAGATPFLRQTLRAAQLLRTRLPSLKLFVCGGASVPPSLVREATAYFERAVVTRVYGSTEVPCTTVGVIDRNDSAHAADTDGRPGLADVKLRELRDAPSREGEICVLGPQMLVGYLHPEDETEAFEGQGYFRTGDIGRWIEGAYLAVTGRAKDIIIRNGENISSKEIEDLLLGHPQVAEVAVVGIPDPRTGERAVAVIVPRDESRPDVESLLGFLESRGVAKFKAPEQVALWESLPKNEAGKVLKSQIRAALVGAP